MLEPLAKRVHDFGWHIQIVATADQLIAVQDVLRRLPTPVVFDHMAHLPQPQGVNHPAFALAAALMEAGRGWVKLSGAYIDTRVGPPSYADVAPVAQAYVKLAPERCVWGSDWPHPTLKAHEKPDDAALVDLLAVWIPDQATRHRVLVENPAALYGFA
jgi:predicted TIM-barrel fold metal-dependent hydrolase